MLDAMMTFVEINDWPSLSEVLTPYSTVLHVNSSMSTVLAVDRKRERARRMPL
ncbi:hypothetical protein PISMIDRAFT_673789 [Pisolithus microcarpus 441]|uniref:Uncharacterized protein n=1 Tax=Pisolithus microcarpus 441 TaxID=765257 RepID=A0A0C9ZPU6_9AGAM|nr:hypothetical protein PISMIDRAFT_673789 [Pisolithus microcarpus 441]